YYHNAPIFWIRAHSFVPFFKSERDGIKISTQLKSLFFETKSKSKAASGVLCSTLFYIWWLTVSDCYHLNKPEIDSFPIDLNNKALIERLSTISEQLEIDLKSKAKRRIYKYETSGRVEYDEFYLKKSKYIIDEIDAVLAEHYGFTPEELDFIINYDIKYRMGKELGEDEDDE
ncbi:MAG: SAM-dependent methyltransferase, partial [Syntrophomonadaceae bacterium]|nr:SAM-dependent methyltransferase [Syntrophomonadaceae bacterium]